MDIQDKKVLVLGGYGLVGTAVCREFLHPGRPPREIQIHSLRMAESEAAREELAAQAAGVGTALSVSAGDVFGLVDTSADRRRKVEAQIGQLEDSQLGDFLLYQLLQDSKPDIVVDCVNTATAIAYGDIFSAANRLHAETADGGIPRPRPWPP